MTKTNNDILLDVIDKIKSEVKSKSQEQYLPNIIEFCESKHYLNLTGIGVELFPIQRIILKTFYRGQPGNENIKLTPEELQLLFDYKLDNVIEKYHSGNLFRELVLVLGRRCISGDTLIFDANSGESKSISDWHNEDGQLSIWTYNEKKKKFEINHAKTLKQGLRECFRITLSNGDYIDCTSNHPLLTPNGWKQTKELKPGDMIAQNNYIPKPDDGEGLQEYEASILGYIIGDGNCTTSRTYFTTNDEKIVKHLQECLDKLSDNMWVKHDNNSISPYLYSIRQREIKFKHKIANTGRRIGVRDTSDLFKFLTKHKLQGKNSKSKRVPNAVFNASSRAKTAFLRAYFSCDGYIGQKGIGGPSVELYSVNKELLSDVQNVLSSLQIDSKLRIKRGDISIIDKSSGKKYDYPDHLSYRLSIEKRESVQKYCQHIGALKNYKIPDMINNEENLNFECIYTIKSIGEKETYDLFINHNHCHNFILNNGIQVHNSGKDFMVSLMALYEAMRLLEMPGGCPFKYYNLAEGNPIYILTVATSADQAKILFTEIKEKMLSSNYFRDKSPIIEMDRISLMTPHDKEKQFKMLKSGIDNAASKVKGSIVIMSGHSNSESLLGKRYYALLLDEVASFKTTGMATSGDRIYSALGPGTVDFKRSTGEFDEKGKEIFVTDSKIISISSPRAEEGMLFKLYNDAPQTKNRLAFKLPTWKVNMAQTEEDLRQDNKFMTASEFSMEFGAEFSGTAGEKFIADRYVDEAMEMGAELGLDQREGGIPGMIYYAHLDPASTSHNYGLIVLHVEERIRSIEKNGQMTKEKVKMFIVDHIRAWHPATKQAINIKDVDKYIEKLAKRFRFAMVSYDNWDSQSSTQQLRRKGIPTKITPFRKQYKMAIYDNLHNLLVNHQIALPHKGPFSQLLEMELKCLKRIYTPTGFKIRPNPEGQVITDDLTDCLAGALGVALDNIYTGYPQSGVVNMPQIRSGGNLTWNIGTGRYSDQQWKVVHRKFGI